MYTSSVTNNRLSVSSTPSYQPLPLEVNMVLEKIFSHVRRENPRDLLNYRLVCHQWNDEILRMLTKTKTSFQIPLRYGPQVPKILNRSNAKKEVQRTLRNVVNISNGVGGTIGSLHFDTVLIDRDFYLGGRRVNPEWRKFLEIHGQSIRHLKFNIRPGNEPGEFENYVSDCEEIVSVENFITAFTLTPNLESLDFCIRYTNYPLSGESEDGEEEDDDVPRPSSRPLPEFTHLKKLKIIMPNGDEDSVCNQHIYNFTSKAPNLTDLYVEGEDGYFVFTNAKRLLLKKFKILMTHFKVENDLIHGQFPLSGNSYGDQGQGFFNLKTVDTDLKYTSNDTKYDSLNYIFDGSDRAESIVLKGSTDNVNSDPLGIPNRTWSRYTSVFPYLKRLEINLTQFNLIPDIDMNPTYETKFPVLETLVLTGYGDVVGNEWTYAHVMNLLPGESRKSDVLLNFHIVGQIRNDYEKLLISSEVCATFPRAVQYFDN